MTYFIGQGKVYAALRNSGGVPQGFMHLGNCSNFEIKVGLGGIRRATGGSEVLPKAFPQGELPLFSLSLEEWDETNLATFLYGSKTTVNSGTITDTLIAFVGKTIPLSKINVTTFTSLKNNAGTVTYTLGTDYTVNAGTGSISIPSGSTITNGSTVKATYTYGGYAGVGAFTTASGFYWVRFEGLNSANSDSPLVVDIFKARIKPLDKLPLIGDAPIAPVLEGQMFYDETNPTLATDGGFFRILKP